MVKPAELPPAAKSEAKAFRDCEHCPEMMNVPAGTFRMGSNDEPTEKPVREVTVGAFALGRYPVTIREWRYCIGDGACSYQPTGDEALPVYNVSWKDAQQYIAWLSKVTKQQYRLPSEAEWEYAARANSIARYWWGDQPPVGKAACRGCGTDAKVNQPMQVGSFPANPLGLSDMTGSVAQWVADCWIPNYQDAPRDATPRTKPACSQYVLRGGAWKSEPRHLRSASRAFYDSDVRYLTNGLRVARQAGN
jgi:formylglycine-generating enzyme required for sulfatase activity